MFDIKKQGLLVILLVLSVVGTACSKSEAEEKQTTETQIVIQNVNQKLVFDIPPKKVITMGPACTEVFCALEISESIVGNTLNNHSKGALPQYKDQYDKIPELNHGSATREAVLSSGADFIYGIDWEFGDGGLDKVELSNYGIQVYESQAKTIEEQYQEIKDIGKIFNVTPKAEKVITSQKQRIDAISSKGVHDVKRVLVYDSGDNGVFTSSGSNFESVLIQKAGGHNIFDSIKEKEWITVSKEAVLDLDPEIIIVHDYDQPTVDVKIKQIKEDATLSQTTAVKKNRIITVPLEGIFPGVRMADTIEYFYENFHKK